jgi:hypothetical protein
MSFYRQARFAYAREIGQKTMNQCRFSNGKARIIRMEKIKASESLVASIHNGLSSKYGDDG